MLMEWPPVFLLPAKTATTSYFLKSTWGTGAFPLGICCFQRFAIAAESRTTTCFAVLIPLSPPEIFNSWSPPGGAMGLGVWASDADANTKLKIELTIPKRAIVLIMDTPPVGEQ